MRPKEDLEAEFKENRKKRLELISKNSTDKQMITECLTLEQRAAQVLNLCYGPCSNVRPRTFPDVFRKR